MAGFARFQGFVDWPRRTSDISDPDADYLIWIAGGISGCAPRLHRYTNAPVSRSYANAPIHRFPADTPILIQRSANSVRGISGVSGVNSVSSATGVSGVSAYPV